MYAFLPGLVIPGFRFTLCAWFSPLLGICQLTPVESLGAAWGAAVFMVRALQLECLENENTTDTPRQVRQQVSPGLAVRGLTTRTGWVVVAPAGCARLRRTRRGTRLSADAGRARRAPRRVLRREGLASLRGGRAFGWRRARPAWSSAPVSRAGGAEPSGKHSQCLLVWRQRPGPLRPPRKSGVEAGPPTQRHLPAPRLRGRALGQPRSLSARGSRRAGGLGAARRLMSAEPVGSRRGDLWFRAIPVPSP